MANDVARECHWVKCPPLAGAAHFRVARNRGRNLLHFSLLRDSANQSGRTDGHFSWNVHFAFISLNND
jgi:hypothetical protein